MKIKYEHMKINLYTARGRKEVAEKLFSISCSAKDKVVYAVRHGVYDGITKTNEETGKMFSMTGEAVRQCLVKVETLFDNQ